jgi:LCP family protein required for cell wall assembly
VGLSRIINFLGVVVAAAAALVAILVVSGATQVTRTILTVSSDPLRDVEIPLRAQTPSTGVAGMLARGERTNILLLGYGGAGHDGTFLTDSLVLASLQPRSGVVTLVSVPRDLWVTLPPSKYAGSYAAKVNEAFAIAAAEGDRDEGIRVADATIEAVLGVDIHRTIVVDFRAFRTVVDGIGGIDVVVDRDFTALYPRNDNPTVDPGWIEIAFTAGAQHMDGETALRYARARYSDGAEGSDFARSLRQQNVILAAKNKIVSTNAISHLFGLLEALRENVRTDLSLSDMQALAEFARGYDDARTVKVALTSDNVLQSGSSATTGYALFPRVSGWGEVHAYLRRALEYPKSLTEEAEVVLAVSARRAELGAAAHRRLTDLGFRVRLQYVDEDADRTTISDGTAGLGNASALFLSAYLNDAPLNNPSATGSILVRLGRDWTAPLELVAPIDEPREGTRAGP